VHLFGLDLVGYFENRGQLGLSEDFSFERCFYSFVPVYLNFNPEYLDLRFCFAFYLFWSNNFARCPEFTFPSYEPFSNCHYFACGHID